MPDLLLVIAFVMAGKPLPLKSSFAASTRFVRTTNRFPSSGPNELDLRSFPLLVLGFLDRLPPTQLGFLLDRSPPKLCDFVLRSLRTEVSSLKLIFTSAASLFSMLLSWSVASV